MRSALLFAASAAFTGAFAAHITSESTYYVTETYIDCSTETSGLATKTNTAVETYCPHCTGGASPGSAPTPKGPVTTYTTVYSELCSTGLQPKTYTITEECSSAGAPRPTDYVPAAFVVTTATCHVCAETPVVATLTTPAPVAPSAAPAGSAPPAAPAVPAAPGSPPAAPPPGSAPSAAPDAPTSGGSSPAAPPPGESAGNPPAAPGAASPPPSGSAPASPAGGATAPADSAPASPAGAAPAPADSAPASPAGAAPASGPAAGPAAKAPYNSAAAPSSAPLATGGPVSPYSSNVPFTGNAPNLSISASLVVTFMATIGLLAFSL
ncbi:MAG: hypothetical protein Q9172_004967 [Xanthocarpia lactea]